MSDDAFDVQVHNKAGCLSMPVQRAFTLIELLVVVIVIALLASLLLPAVKLVRDAAKNTKCVSNQRGIAMAIQAYATDNEGFLPYRDNNNGWPNLAINYFESQYQIAPQINRNDIFHCPFAVAEINNPWLFSFLFSNHYGMNMRIRVSWNPAGYWNGIGSPPPSPTFRPQPPIAIASLPANLILLTENKAWSTGSVVYFEDAVDYAGYGPWPVRHRGSTAAVAPIIWHARTINFVCVDGHVDRVTGVWDQEVMKLRFLTSASVL